MTGARTGSRVPRIATPGFWPAFRKTQPARQRRPHPTVVPSHPAVAASRRGVSGRLRRQRAGRPAHPAHGRCRVVVLYSSWQVGGERIGPQRDRAGGSKEHRQADAVSLGARAFWPASGGHSRRVSAVHTPRSYRRTQRVSGRLRRQRAGRPAHPAHGRCRVVVLYSSWQVGGERIRPQRDRAGGSKEHRQADAVSLGARAFWPASGGHSRRVSAVHTPRSYRRTQRSPLHGAVFLAAFGGSGPEGPRTQPTVVAVLWFSTAVGRSVGSASARAKSCRWQ